MAAVDYVAADSRRLLRIEERLRQIIRDVDDARLAASFLQARTDLQQATRIAGHHEVRVRTQNVFRLAALKLFRHLRRKEGSSMVKNTYIKSGVKNAALVVINTEYILVIINYPSKYTFK